MKTTVEAIKFVLVRSFKAARLLFVVYILANIFLSFTNILNVFIFKEIIDAANEKHTLASLGMVTVVFLRLALEILSRVMGRFAEYIWYGFGIKQMFYNYTDF